MSKMVSTRKLSLNKTSLRVLTGNQLGRVAGAFVEGASVVADDCHPVGTTRPETHVRECVDPPTDPPSQPTTTLIPHDTLWRSVR